MDEENKDIMHEIKKPYTINSINDEINELS